MYLQPPSPSTPLIRLGELPPSRLSFSFIEGSEGSKESISIMAAPSHDPWQQQWPQQPDASQQAESSSSSTQRNTTAFDSINGLPGPLDSASFDALLQSTPQTFSGPSPSRFLPTSQSPSTAFAPQQHDAQSLVPPSHADFGHSPSSHFAATSPMSLDATSFAAAQTPYMAIPQPSPASQSQQQHDYQQQQHLSPQQGQYRQSVSSDRGWPMTSKSTSLDSHTAPYLHREPPMVPRRTSTVDGANYPMLSLSGASSQHHAFSPTSATARMASPYALAASAPTAASHTGLDGFDQRDLQQMQAWDHRPSIVSAYSAVSSSSSMGDGLQQYPQRHLAQQPHQLQLQHQHQQLQGQPSNEKPWRFVDPEAPAMPAGWQPAGLTAFPHSLESFTGSTSWDDPRASSMGNLDEEEDDDDEREGASPGSSAKGREKASRRQGVTCDQCREKHLRCDLADRIAEVEERKKRTYSEITDDGPSSTEAKAVCSRCAEKGFVCNKTTAAPSRRYPRPSRTGKRIEQAR